MSKKKRRQEEKLRLVMELMRGREEVKEVCRKHGVSRQTAYKYLGRFKREGLAGLVEHSRRPQGGGWGEEWKRRVLRLRSRRPTWGARKLRWWLGTLHPRRSLPTERTLHRWLGEAGLAKRKVRKRAGPKTQSPARRAVRCNEVWTVDFKGWFRSSEGRRIEPLTVRDMYSRYLLGLTPVPATSEAAVRRVFVRLFRRHGLPEAIRADRGAPFCGTGPHGLTTLSLWWHRLGIRVEFVDRASRIDNNAHEQLHRVLKEELMVRDPGSHAALVRWLRAWRDHYNHHRPHQALGQRPPATRYRPSPRRAPRLAPPLYPSGWLVRQVKGKGEILLGCRRFGIGRAFAGLPVGLKPSKDSSLRVYFGPLLLGTLNPASDRSLRP